MTGNRAPCWAVTGPTGAGKSRFCALLAKRGALVIEADEVAHELLDQSPLQGRLVSVFGAGVLGPDGRIDRSSLGRLVFHEPAVREKLDALVHPPLAAALVAKLAAARLQRTPLVILEAAVYFVLPGPPPVDWILVVTATPAVRLARLATMGLDPAAAKARLAAQNHLESTWLRADHIIANDGSSTLLAAEAADLWRARVAPLAKDG